MERPLTLAFASLFFAATGILYLLLGCVVLAGYEVVLPPFLEGLDAVLGYFLLAFGAFQLLVGWGLYNFRKWSWPLALGTAAISALSSLLYADFFSALIYSTLAASVLLNHGLLLTPAGAKHSTTYIKERRHRFVKKKE